jgi:5-methylcytosine-specific restriction endonuclease McrA
MSIGSRQSLFNCATIWDKFIYAAISMGKVLVLNASYEPLNITSWRRAVVLLLKGKAEQLEFNGQFVYSGFPLPSVIRLRHYVRVPYKEIPLTRRNILERDRHTCQYCNYKGEQLTLDHVIPRSRGGGDTWENLVTACMRCNVKKGNRTPKEASMSLKHLPRKPYSSLHFEIVKNTRGNLNQEWRKYVIGIN